MAAEWSGDGWQSSQLAQVQAGKRSRRAFPPGSGCQVERCKQTLDQPYHKKYHVRRMGARVQICALHSKAPSVVIQGMQQRFCQKCGKFQALEEFTDRKRTCQRALDSHNARRRKREEERRQAGDSSLKRSGSSLSGSPVSKAAAASRRRSDATPSGEGGDDASASMSEQLPQRPTPSSVPSAPPPEAPAAGPPLLAGEGSSSLLPLSREQGSNQSLLQGWLVAPNPHLRPASQAPPGATQPQLGSTPPAPMQPQLGSPLPEAALQHMGSGLAGALRPLGLRSPAQLDSAAAMRPILRGATPSHSFAMPPQYSATAAMRLAPDPVALHVAEPASEAVPAAPGMLGAEAGDPDLLAPPSRLVQALLGGTDFLADWIMQGPSGQLQDSLLAEPAVLPALATLQSPAVPYLSPARLHRVSIKVFGCTPDQLGPGIRTELETVLAGSPALVESTIRPGCTHLTADLHLSPEAAAAAKAASAEQVLHALRCPHALGAAASNPVLLQWLGRLAASTGGAAGVQDVAAAEPTLLVQPACIAVPAGSKTWPLVQLQVCGIEGLQNSSVLCRQAGQQLSVEVWGTSMAGAASALADAYSNADTATSSSSDSDGGPGTSGASSPTSSLAVASASPASSDDGNCESSLPEREADDSRRAAATAAAAPAQPACLWVRPVGLRPGRCEMEVQLQLGPLCGDSRLQAVLLTAAAPLLVLRDAAAVREVQGLVRASGRPGAAHLDDLLRDIGTAAAFLEQQQQQQQQQQGAGGGEDAADDSPLPSFVAAAARAAADYVQPLGLPAVHALLRQAAAAAASAAAAPVAEASSSSVKSCAVEEEGDDLAGAKAAARAPLSKGTATAPAGPGLPCRLTRADTFQARLQELEEAVTAVSTGAGCCPHVLTAAGMARLCATLTSVFVAVMAVRLGLAL